MRLISLVMILLFSQFVEAQEGGGACPRLERKRVGSCGISIADPCHSGSQCVCLKCGPPRNEQIPEIQAGACISSTTTCRDNGPEIPPTCTTVCTQYGPPSCRLVPVQCVEILEMRVNPEQHTCTEPCPPCPPDFEASCDGIPCGPVPGQCPAGSGG